MRNGKASNTCHSGLIGFVVPGKTCHNGLIACHNGPTVCHSGPDVCYSGSGLASYSVYSVYSGRHSRPPLERAANRRILRPFGPARASPLLYWPVKGGR